MNSEIFSRNLRRLRLQKNLTQEQLAGRLGVSVQSISRWECGNTLPDVMLLPELAKLYGVTVDDLYRADATGYPSYAQRLLAVYEASGRTEDFLAAEQEFARMSAAELTADDLRSWGVLYHYMMKHCADAARRKLEQALGCDGISDQVYTAAAGQELALARDLGKAQEEAVRYERLLAEDPGDHRLWVLCAAAYEYAEAYEQALAVAKKGLERFPEQAALSVRAGDICRAMKRYDEAFTHWRRALELDASFLDAAFSMGFCYEELGEYRKAYAIWTDLVRELDRRGLVIEREFPAGLAENCLKRMAE